MGRYLIEIVRGTRAERPSETDIYQDSVKSTTGDFANMVQEVDKDNYFIFSGDPQFELLRILSLMNFNPYKLAAGDGFRVLPYPHNGGSGDDLRAEAQVEVQYTKENTSGTEVCESVAAAYTWIAANLVASDGYVIIDELAGFPSLVIASRPSLWIQEDTTNLVKNNNLHGRVDSDRI